MTDASDSRGRPHDDAAPVVVDVARRDPGDIASGKPPATPRETPGRLVLRIGLVASVYFAAALATRLIALPPEYIAPIWPAAGFAVAALLVWGLRCWPGVWLGAFAFHATFDPTLAGIVAATIVASASAAQATLGAWLTRGCFAGPAPLVRDRDIWRFLVAAGPLACLLAPTASIEALQALDSSKSPAPWLAWWTAETLGVLLFAPLALLLWPNLRPLRALGTIRIATPLVMTAVLLAGIHLIVERLHFVEARRLQVQRMEALYESALLPLTQRIAALGTVERLFAVGGDVTWPQFTTFTEELRSWPGLLAIAWLPRVGERDRAAFEASARNAGAEGYEILEAGDETLVRAGSRGEYFPVRYIEPLAANEDVIGFDHNSSVPSRAALEQARDGATTVASTRARLVRSGREGIFVFVPVYEKGFAAAKASIEERRRQLRGFVVGTLDAAALFNTFGEAATRQNFAYSVSDATPGDTAALLARTLPDGTTPAWSNDLPFAGRVLRVEMNPASGSWHIGMTPEAPFAYVGAMVGAFLVVFAALGAAGRNAATTLEVASRTAALRASETRFRRLVEQSPMAVFVQSAGLIAYASPKALAMFGARSELELVGRPIVDILHPDQHAVARERTRRLNEEGADVGSCEYMCVRLDGSLFHGEATATPYLHDGKPGALVLIHDITPRKQAEEQRDRFFELSPDLLCVADLDGRLKRVNPAFTQTLGWSETQLVGQRILDFVHPDDRDATLAEMLRNASGATTLKFDSRFRDRAGEWRWLAWRAMPASDGLVYCAARDVTAQRAAAAELEAAREAAESASRAKSAFLAAMSHEIRTPMNGVVGMVEVLARTPLSEHQADMVRTVSDSAVTLLGIIDDILDFSKIEAGRMKLELTTLGLVELVEGVCVSLVPVAERQAVELDLFVAPDVPEWIEADSVRLRQVLYNVVGNAIKFSGGRSEQRGRVKVRVAVVGATAPCLEFRVEDNGIGMTAETLSSLFQPFTQGEASTTRRYGGTGLGLTICQRLCTLMEGDIRAESRPGAGSTFTITLPFQRAEAPQRPATVSVAGIDCVVVAAGLPFEASHVHAYLSRDGARVRVVATIREAFAAARAAGSTVVVVQDHHEGARALAEDRHPISRLSNARLLLLGRTTSAPSPVNASDATVVQLGVLRREALQRAVAVAAGRASPEAPRSNGEPALPVDPGTKPRVAEARARGELVLVAEDDLVNQRVILQQLALLGYAAEVASNGEEALRMWRAGAFAVLLTDLHMPLMDGYELTARIRESESGRVRMPIIALTANALRGEANRARASGVDDYLTKPVSLTVLGATLEKWLGTVRPPARPPGEATRPAQASAKAPGDVDVAVLKRLVGDDEDTVRDVLANFLSSLRRQWIPDLRDAASANDARRIAATAHKVKSAARSVGALAFGDLCAELENACRVGQREVIDHSVDSFHVVAAAVDATVTSILDRECA